MEIERTKIVGRLMAEYMSDGYTVATPLVHDDFDFIVDLNDGTLEIITVDDAGQVTREVRT